jgi:hypothetical protein
MRKSLLIAAAAAVAFFPGCAREVIIPEALQQTVNSKIYTKCNIWYQNPDDISSVNIQKGKFIPFGSEIEAVEATERKVVFKDMKGIQYTIRFDEQLMMIPVETYIRQMFTLSDKSEQTKDIDPAVVSKLEKGIVTSGMNRRDVLLAYGTPAAFRTPTLENSTWIYWIDDNSTIRVVYRADKVKTILNLND